MDFKLPDIGEGIHEGEITKWLVKEGDTLVADQPMVEVMTDKATVEIPSPVAGAVTKIYFKEGETVEVGKVIITIGGGAPAKEAPKPAVAPEASPKETFKDKPREAAPQSQPQKEAPKEVKGDDDVLPFHILATPATRKLARDLNVDLKQIKGTGAAGRVTKMDVQMANQGHEAAQPRTSHSVATTSSVPALTRGALQRIPLKGVRKRISESMAHSKHTAAHFTYVEEVDMTEVVALRKKTLGEAEKRDVKLTFLPFVIKALIPALKEFPYLNASLDDEKQDIVLKGDYNIGIAADTPNGLIVPVVKNADSKSVWEVSKEIMELAERARNGKSTLEDLKGGTFTITSIGSIGGVFATPIINHPEVAILGVNAIRKRPMVHDDQIVIREMMYLSHSVDHRVVDGAGAARFMNRLIYFLTEPSRLVFA